MHSKRGKMHLPANYGETLVTTNTVNEQMEDLMIELTNAVLVERQLEEVWTYVGDPTRWHTWRNAMSAPAVKLDEGPIEIGSTYDYQSAFMGRTAEAKFEVVAYEPQRQITMKTAVPIPAELTFRCEEDGGGTRVIQETEGEVGGFFGVAEPLIKPLMKRQFQKDLNKLKAETEAA